MKQLLLVCLCFSVVPALADYCPHRDCRQPHVWEDNNNDFHVWIDKQYLQTWHPIGRTVKFRGDGADIDRWSCCSCTNSDWEYIITDWCWDHNWSGSQYLRNPKDQYQVSWNAWDSTPTTTPDIITYDGIDTYGIHICDVGERKDETASTTVEIGAFKVGVAIVSNSYTQSGADQQLGTIWQTEYYNYNLAVTNFVAAQPKIHTHDVTTNEASLSKYINDGKPDPYCMSKVLHRVTSDVSWTFLCAPDVGWGEDTSGFVTCNVGAAFDAEISSQVYEFPQIVPTTGTPAIDFTLLIPGLKDALTDIGNRLTDAFGEQNPGDAQAIAAVVTALESNDFPNMEFDREHTHDSNTYSWLVVNGVHVEAKSRSTSLGSGLDSILFSWTEPKQNGDYQAEANSITAGGIALNVNNLGGNIKAQQEGNIEFGASHPKYTLGTPIYNPEWINY